MNLYLRLLRDAPDLTEKLIELYRDELAARKRQGRTYSIDHFIEELGDELFSWCEERKIPTRVEGRKVSA